MLYVNIAIIRIVNDAKSIISPRDFLCDCTNSVLTSYEHRLTKADNYNIIYKEFKKRGNDF